MKELKQIVRSLSNILNQRVTRSQNNSSHHLGFYQDGDAHTVVERHSVVDHAHPLGRHADGAQTNVSPLVVKLPNKPVPVSIIFVPFSITSIWGNVELVLDADRVD